jgi:hypothetical protein
MYLLPEGTHAMGGEAIMMDIAFSVKCSLHGDRFSWKDVKSSGVEIYEAAWLRTKKYDIVLRGGYLPKSLSDPPQFGEQYIKAYLASFPRDLWPYEEEHENGRSYLRLKDGTRLSGPPEEDLRIVGRLLAARGQIVDPRLLGERNEDVDKKGKP